MALYRAAAESGYHVAQYYFGLFLYSRGDAALAVEWIRRAADQKYAPALTASVASTTTWLAYKLGSDDEVDPNLLYP